MPKIILQQNIVLVRFVYIFWNSFDLLYIRTLYWELISYESDFSTPPAKMKVSLTNSQRAAIQLKVPLTNA